MENKYLTLGRTNAATTRSTKMIARKSSVCWYFRSILINACTLGVTFPSATAAPIITSTCSPPETAVQHVVYHDANKVRFLSIVNYKYFKRKKIKPVPTLTEEYEIKVNKYYY